MKAEQFNALIKDMSKAVSRVIAKPQLLDDLTADQRTKFAEKLEAYAPKSDIGRESRSHVIDIMAGVKEVDTLDKGELLNNRTAVLFVKVVQPGFTKVIDTKQFIEKSVATATGQTTADLDDDDETDLKRHKVIQMLYGKDFLKPLVKQRQEFMAWLDRHAVPSTLLSSDNYLVPQGLINFVIEKIGALEAERAQLIDQLEGQWESVISDAKKRLGVHYDAAQYQDFDSQVRSRFRPKYSNTFVKSRWRSLQPAEALKEINKAAYEQERELAKVDWEDTFSEIRDALRGGFMDLISGFSEALGKGEDGKYKTFHASKVEHLKDFIRTFEARDLTNDEELESLAKQASEILNTVDVANIRKDTNFRDELAGKFTAIKESAKKLAESKGRRLNFDV